MKKDILNKGILIPLVIGIVLAIAVFCSFLKMGNLFPVLNGTTIMYHDQNNEAKLDEGAKLINTADLKQNQKIGTLSYGNKALDIRYQADYSKMLNAASLNDGSAFGKTGVGYLCVLQNNINDLDKQKVSVESDFGNYNYRYVTSFETENENDVFLRNSGVSKGIVIYYQKAEKYGFTSSYKCLVYEEVQA